MEKKFLVHGHGEFSLLQCSRMLRSPGEEFAKSQCCSWWYLLESSPVILLLSVKKRWEF